MSFRLWIRLMLVLLCVGPRAVLLGAEDPPDPTQQDYLLAAQLQNNRLYELAIPHWEKVIAGSPDAARVDKARYYLATCQFRQKQFASSREQLKKLLKSNPPRDDKKTAPLRRDALLLLAMNYLRLKDQPAAKETLELFRTEFPDEQKFARKVESGERLEDLPETPSAAVNK